MVKNDDWLEGHLGKIRNYQQRERAADAYLKYSEQYIEGIVLLIKEEAEERDGVKIFSFPIQLAESESVERWGKVYGFYCVGVADRLLRSFQKEVDTTLVYSTRAFLYLSGEHSLEETVDDVLREGCEAHRRGNEKEGTILATRDVDEAFKFYVSPTQAGLVLAYDLEKLDSEEKIIDGGWGRNLYRFSTSPKDALVAVLRVYHEDTSKDLLERV